MSKDGFRVSKERVLEEARRSMITLATKAGVRASHRPKDIEVNEGSAVLYPDYHTSPNGELEVGQIVTVDVTQVVPWTRIIPHQMEDHDGMGVSQFRRDGGLNGYEWNRYIVLSFATMSLRGRGATVEGVFAALGQDPDRCYTTDLPYRGEWVIRDRGKSNKLLLFWIGCLEPADD